MDALITLTRAQALTIARLLREHSEAKTVRIGFDADGYEDPLVTLDAGWGTLSYWVHDEDDDRADDGRASPAGMGETVTPVRA